MRELVMLVKWKFFQIEIDFLIFMIVSSAFFIY